MCGFGFSVLSQRRSVDRAHILKIAYTVSKFWIVLSYWEKLIKMSRYVCS